MIEETDLVPTETVPEIRPERAATRARPTWITARRASGAALALVVVIAAYVAVHLHRT